MVQTLIHNWSSVRRSGWAFAAALPLFAGCGDAPAPAPTAPGSVAESGSGAAAGVAGEAASSQAASTEPTGDARSKTKWLGNIPYDVFYDQPLVIAAGNDTIPLAPGPSATTAEPGKMATPGAPSSEPPAAGTAAASTAGPASPSGSLDWLQLASAEVLNDEVTRLRNALTTNLNTLATYNRNIEAVANDAACLAALAAVVEVHPEEVNWQSKAKFVRDLGYEAYMKADGTGRGPYDATKEPFEQLVAILNGGPPPDREAADKVPMADIADRSELMKRIKRSYDYLRAEINTAERFKESPTEIVREASVLAAFGGMISTESYDSAGEEKYRQFIRDFIQANVDVTAAAKADDFAAFEQARSRIQTACDACHGEYAFGDEGL